MPPSHFDHLNDAESVDETNQSVVSDKVLDDSTRSETELNCENAENKEKIQKTEWICYYTIFNLVLSIAIATTATLFSYRSYQNDQQVQFDTNFENAASLVAMSLYGQQKKLKTAIESFASTISIAATLSSAQWPLFTLPLFQSTASNVITQSGAVSLVVSNFVSATETDIWLEYADSMHENLTTEGHFLRYGNSDNLSKEAYHPYFTQINNSNYAPDIKRPFYFPSWSRSPPPLTFQEINMNLYSLAAHREAFDAILRLKNETVITPIYAIGKETEEAESITSETQLDKLQITALHPVVRDIHNNESDVVATIAVDFQWKTALENILPKEVGGLIVEVTNTCNQTYTYVLVGPNVTLKGRGSLHEEKYNSKVVVVDFSFHSNKNYLNNSSQCHYSLLLYPSTTLEASYSSNDQSWVPIMIGVSFLLLIALFLVYEYLVHSRTRKIVQHAVRTEALVTSLFPGEIGSQLIDREINSKKPEKSLKGFLHQCGEINELKGKPMADLFLETTVLFADLVGFTAWSSSREPAIVFTLLETLFYRFDEIAIRRRVFKVETVGDCYVAVTGLPDPRKDHAVIMARFARAILEKMEILTKDMERTLGPDTGDLSLRIGMHSGPVTGGVLRGERSRFQLFGDTMNTTARIEALGESGRIHISEDTAQLLVVAGKKRWVEKRNGQIEAKGKGLLVTYWLTRTEDEERSRAGRKNEKNLTCSTSDENNVSGFDKDRNDRLIEWNVDTLLRLLKQVIAYRNAKYYDEGCVSVIDVSDAILPTKQSFLDEVAEIIALPEYDSMTTKRTQDPEDVEVSSEVVSQLRAYVIGIASMYRENAFHNFEHASHVMMSVIKLLSRIVAPNEIDCDTDDEAATLHDHTFGITSDPLTQFACAFGALLHDVDHNGVPNAQLVEEQAPVAIRYKNRSVAEQNSLELSWNLLLDDSFKDLRAELMPTEEECTRFRQLVVNVVMATDIVDKDLKALRNARWDKAFEIDRRIEQFPSGIRCDNDNEQFVHEAEARDQINRKATIIIEHLIQASDVSHTMQHWHIYRKWNERFFVECYVAYLTGHAKKDPAEYWYQGEIGFFDFYIIPLAKKLKECGVFGKSSSEYLDYAMRNRNEWEARGQEVVIQMVDSMQNFSSEGGRRRLKRLKSDDELKELFYSDK